MLFQVRDPEVTLGEVSQSALREVVGQSTLQGCAGRCDPAQVTQRTMELVQRMLDSYHSGIEISSVNLTDVQVPDPVVPSQHDANKALADEEGYVKQAQAYANRIVPEAQGRASSIQQDAEAYKARVVDIAQGQAARFLDVAAAYERAPAVTRERLYLESMEKVLGRANKVIVDSKSGAGGNVVYLPLDKLMGRSTGTNAAVTGRGAVGATRAGGRGRRDGSERSGSTVRASGRAQPERSLDGRQTGYALGGRTGGGSWCSARWPRVVSSRCRKGNRPYAHSSVPSCARITNRDCIGCCPGTTSSALIGGHWRQHMPIETFLTNDNRGLIVDFYILWRVSDASAYFQATGASEDVASQRPVRCRQGWYQVHRGPAYSRTDCHCRALGS